MLMRGNTVEKNHNPT